MRMKMCFLYSGVAFCLIAILTLPSSLPKALAYYGGDTINMIDVNGHRQGYWKITAEITKQKGFLTPTSIATEGKYIDSKREGLWFEYYPSGSRKAEISYRNDLQNGETKMFYENGSLKSETTYLNDLPEGISRTYYPDSKLWTEFTWTEGRLQGPAKTYYPNGNLYEEGTWQHDFWGDEYKIYTESGVLKRTENKPFVIHLSDSNHRK